MFFLLIFNIIRKGCGYILCWNIIMIKYDCLFCCNLDVECDVFIVKCLFFLGDEFYWLYLLGWNCRIWWFDCYKFKVLNFWYFLFISYEDLCLLVLFVSFICYCNNKNNFFVCYSICVWSFVDERLKFFFDIYEYFF